VRRAFIAASILFTVACQRDPGRDVKPLPDPLRTPAPAPAATGEIIPLEDVAKSQQAALSQLIANTQITLTYSRPVARGRTLFGALVPYDKVWHPGADKATAMSVTRNITVDGHMLPAGKYSLWTIPRTDRWTMIFSKAADTYHEPYPGESQDALRFDVTPERGPHMEALTYYFPVVDGKSAVLRLHWGEVMVPLAIQVP
jgi:hypothetical protein